MNQFVGWQDYAGASGGVVSPQEVYALNKALTAGSDINNPGAAPGVGFPLRIESLEATLKNVQFRMEHIRFWRMLPKIPAFNTVEEFNRVTSYGSSRLGAFIPEIARPEQSDATYERAYVKMKYTGITRQVSLVSTLIRPAHGNVIAQEKITGTMRLLEQIERSLFFGRSDLDEVQWDGLEKLIEDGATANHIIDLRGRTLSEDVLTDAALTIMAAPSYGIPTHLILEPQAKADLVKGIFPRARFDQFSKDDNGMIGADAAGITTTAGDIRFVQDVFLGDEGPVSGLSAEGDAAKRPATPVVTTAITTPIAAASQFAADDAGSYIWWVVAANKFGFSAPVQVAAATAVAAGDEATWGVTPGAGPAVSHYFVYRTRPGGAAGTARRILRVANTVGAGETTFHDYNARLPGTGTAFLVQGNSDNFAFKQLAPLMLIPVGTQDTSITWMQVLMGGLALYTPRHNVIIRNIGRSADFVGVP